MLVNQKEKKNCEKKKYLASRHDASSAPAASNVAAAVSVVAVCHCPLVAFRHHVVRVVCDGDGGRLLSPSWVPYYTRMTVNVIKSKKEKNCEKKTYLGVAS